jgi:hypothetical protein
METTSLIKETTQEQNDSAKMREEILRRLLKEQNYSRVLSYTCNCCWNVMRVQRRSLSKTHIQWLITLKDLNKTQEYLHHTVVQNKCHERFNISVSDYPVLKHLSLIEENDNTEGFYKISFKGLTFLENKCKCVKSYYPVPNSDILIMGSKTVGYYDIMVEKNNMKYFNKQTKWKQRQQK